MRSIIVVCLTALLATAPLFAQRMEDVVYLKNGRIIRGIIIEHIPGQSLKIKTAGGSPFVYEINEIAEVGRAPLMVRKRAAEEATEEATSVEIGTMFGFSGLSSDGDDQISIGLPSSPYALFGNPSLYAAWFPNKRLFIGPEFGFGRYSLAGEDEADGVSITSLYIGGRSAFFLQDNAISGPYIVGIMGSRALILADVTDVDSETDLSAGTNLGYQWRLGPDLVLRAEGGFRRWFDKGINHFSLLLGLGTGARHVAIETNGPAPEVEIGTLFGLSRRLEDFDFYYGTENFTITTIGVPAAPNLLFGGPWVYLSYIPSIYFVWFPNEKLSMGPEISFGSLTKDGNNITSLFLGVRGAYSLRTNTNSGAYILGKCAVARASRFQESDTDFSAGGGMGYQWRLGPAFVLRAEGLYWFDKEINSFSLLLGLGTRL